MAVASNGVSFRGRDRLDRNRRAGHYALQQLHQVKHLHALIDRRTRAGSTIFCTQLPPSKWHDRMEEKILADAIIDRITAGAHTITVTCTDSMRRHFTTHE